MYMKGGTHDRPELKIDNTTRGAINETRTRNILLGRQVL